METVKVISGHIIRDNKRYDVGDELEVPEEQAQIWERLGVAKTMPQSIQEDRSVAVIATVKTPADNTETTEQPTGSEMAVDDIPFERPHNKRGRRKKG